LPNPGGRKGKREEKQQLSIVTIYILNPHVRKKRKGKKGGRKRLNSYSSGSAPAIAGKKKGGRREKFTFYALLFPSCTEGKV